MRRMALAGLCMAALWQDVGIGQSRLSASEAIPPTELEAFVDGVVQQVMAQEHIAGAAVSVVQDGALVLKKGYGFADVASGRRVDPDTTLFRIGSITKTFTWLAVREAVEAGRFDLEGIVYQYLPPELRFPVEPFSEPMRLRHLMTHYGEGNVTSVAYGWRDLEAFNASLEGVTRTKGLTGDHADPRRQD